MNIYMKKYNRVKKQYEFDDVINKIEEMNEALTETQKELQAVRDEKSILEKKLQEIQETLKEKKQNKYMDKNENLVERIARW